MIRSSAVCEACDYSEALSAEDQDHPGAWPVLIDQTGKHYFCSHMCVAQSVMPTTNPSLRAYPLGLTYLEVRILEQIATGKSNKEAAAALGIVLSTLKNHLTEVNKKLGTADRLQAVLRAHAARVINVNRLSRRVVPIYDYDQQAA